MRLNMLPATLVVLLLAPFTHAAPADDGWNRVRQLAPGTRIHVSADTSGATCKLRSADDSNLSCDGAHGKVFPRSAVRSVKLTRYAVSTAAGLGIGAGVGALIGVAAVRPNPKALIDFPSIGRALFAVGGGLAGAAILGPTDTFRGPTIYMRPKP